MNLILQYEQQLLQFFSKVNSCYTSSTLMSMLHVPINKQSDFYRALNNLVDQGYLKRIPLDEHGYRYAYQKTDAIK